MPLSQEQMFEALYSQFPAGDELLWLWVSKSYLRVRRYDDGVWLAGAWTGYGFHEDGLKSGLAVAQAIEQAPQTLAMAA